MKFEVKTRSKGSLNLSVGAQTLWSCSTHQFYNFWKFHRKISIFSEGIDDFQFHLQSRFRLEISHLQTNKVWGVKSKIVDNFTKNQYFLMKFSEVVKLMSTATSQSLSTNGQVWTTFWMSFGSKFHFFAVWPIQKSSKNHRFSRTYFFSNRKIFMKKISFFFLVFVFMFFGAGCI